MSTSANAPHPLSTNHFVPGTCYLPGGPSPDPSSTGPVCSTRRDPALRRRYLDLALSQVPRLLGAVDRHPYRPTYGCLDRQYWHYRTAAFPSEMFQEGALPLALVYTTNLPGNRWHGSPRVRELAVAAIRFAARSCHADGSCDDYYPFERALGAAVFSLRAAARAYQVLGLADAEILSWLQRRADWIIHHDESGRLANHHALAALALVRVFQITHQERYRQAAEERIARVLDWQHAEGWFDEYGGADPGYQTLTIDCLAAYRRASGTGQLDQPLRRAVQFACLFLHPDGSLGGPCGSRGTYLFYPHGLERLAAENPAAADLADGFLAAVASGRQADLSDDRMFAHPLAGYIGAYLDWSPLRPPSNDEPADQARHLPAAGLFVRRSHTTHTVVSTARGGVFKHFAADGRCFLDAGLVLQTENGRTAVSQWHDRGRRAECVATQEGGYRITVGGPLHEVRFETASPLKQSLLHGGMWLVGRWCRTAVRRLLQRRLITARRELPIHHRRTIELLPGWGTPWDADLRITDTIELTDRRLRVRRLGFGTDHESAYVAASAVYQDAVLQPWSDLTERRDELNTKRRLTLVREVHPAG